MSTTIGAGSYALRCVFSNGVVLTSRSWTVTGSASGAVPGYPADAGPRPRRAGHRLPRLSSAAACPDCSPTAETLDADVEAGNLPKAKTDWLTAHLDYERLGAAYNTFGDFDDEINGMANGLPLGTADPCWTGFFRIEYGLWHGAARRASCARSTEGLVADVQGLIQDFPERGGRPGRPAAAHPRDPGERAAVPAHRHRRLRQRHHPGHPRTPTPRAPRQVLRHHHPADPGARSAAADHDRPGTGHGPGPTCSPTAHADCGTWTRSAALTTGPSASSSTPTSASCSRTSPRPRPAHRTDLRMTADTRPRTRPSGNCPFRPCVRPRPGVARRAFLRGAALGTASARPCSAAAGVGRRPRGRRHRDAGRPAGPASHPLRGAAPGRDHHPAAGRRHLRLLRRHRRGPGRR